MKLKPWLIFVPTIPVIVTGSFLFITLRQGITDSNKLRHHIENTYVLTEATVSSSQVFLKFDGTKEAYVDYKVNNHKYTNQLIDTESVSLPLGSIAQIYVNKFNGIAYNHGVGAPDSAFSTTLAVVDTVGGPIIAVATIGVAVELYELQKKKERDKHYQRIDFMNNNPDRK